MTVISSVATQRKRVALTFDDGPHPSYTGQILDALAAEEARATFFALGRTLNDATIKVLERTVAEGHDVGNHTHSHLHFDTCTDATIGEEIRRTHVQLGEILGEPPTLIRPPYGEALERVDALASPLGYRATVGWSIQAEDWLMPPAETIVQRVLAELAPGSIVLLHDGGRDSREPTVEAVRQLLPELRRRGYEPVTVTQLLADDVRCAGTTRSRAL